MWDNNMHGRYSVNASTISGNSAGHAGGGIYLGLGHLEVTSSTITGNRAGIGVFNYGNDRGGGIGTQYGQYIHLDHSIVAGNSGRGSVASNASGVLTLLYSLVGVGQGSTIFSQIGGQVGTSDAPVDPKLGPLANNGGPTWTHAPLPGSPAIDAGDVSTFIVWHDAVPDFDQRGAPFARLSGPQIDIGAVEYEPIPSTVFGDFNLDGVVDAADYSVWRDHLGNIVTPYTSADGNGNGVVDAADYEVWKSHFGQTNEQGAGSREPRIHRKRHWRSQWHSILRRVWSLIMRGIRSYRPRPWFLATARRSRLLDPRTQFKRHWRSK
jgi:Dockerin type I domain